MVVTSRAATSPSTLNSLQGAQLMPGKFELRKSLNGQYHFKLKAPNREPLLSSEMYNSKSGAENGIEPVKKNAQLDGRYERKISASWLPYFALKAANDEPIGTSEMYSSTIARDTGIESVKLNAPNALVLDIT
jgi:uncharacterized protein YegP (UPF0339 family)